MIKHLQKDKFSLIIIKKAPVTFPPERKYKFYEL